jgi:hypothetical protein
MAHGDLRYDDIRIGNKGACLNYNLFGVCKDKACSYRHARAKPSADRIKTVADKLKPAVQSFMAAGAPLSRGKGKGPHDNNGQRQHQHRRLQVTSAPPTCSDMFQPSSARRQPLTSQQEPLQFFSVHQQRQRPKWTTPKRTQVKTPTSESPEKYSALVLPMKTIPTLKRKVRPPVAV